VGTGVSVLMNFFLKKIEYWKRSNCLTIFDEFCSWRPAMWEDHNLCLFSCLKFIYIATAAMLIFYVILFCRFLPARRHGRITEASPSYPSLCKVML